MNTATIPTKYKDKFQLVFVTMFWSNPLNPIYEEWTEGRIDIRTPGDSYANDEVRYCTKKTKEWSDFQEKYSGKWITAEELEIFKKELADNFKKSPTDPN